MTDCGPPADFTILTVCTGNICRSPLAEVAFRAELGSVAAVRFDVGSAGTRAEPGAAAPAESRASAAVVALDLATHRARELTPQLLAEADLVLGLSREHRRSAATLLPRATRKSFTLREFARIATTLDDDVASLRDGIAHPRERLLEAVRLAAASRGTIGAGAAPDELDVVDPYRRDASVYYESRRTTLDAVADVAAFLRRVTTL